MENNKKMTKVNWAKSRRHEFKISMKMSDRIVVSTHV